MAEPCGEGGEEEWSAQAGSHALSLAGLRTHLVKTDSPAMGPRWDLIISPVGPVLLSGSQKPPGRIHTPHAPAKPGPVMRTLLANPPGHPTLQAR